MLSASAFAAVLSLPTIDDVQLVSLDQSGGCLLPASYGVAKENSLGLAAHLDSIGTPSFAVNDFHLILTRGLPNQPALLFFGTAPDNTPFLGGFRLVQPPLIREASLTLDASGGFSFPYPLTRGMIGTSRYFQTWYRDPAHPDGTDVGLSDGLLVVFCD